MSTTTQKRTDVVARVILATPEHSYSFDVLREDVTSTNGAYRCVRDDMAERVQEFLSLLLNDHRGGKTLQSFGGAK